VASSLAQRTASFEHESKDGQIRRSRLTEFISDTREASKQLLANLQRAATLIQSFKQVAVDRSNAERRMFDLSHSTEQIVSSLRPGLRRSQVGVAMSVPEGIMMDSYPGHYGQVLTNLFVNAVTHGFEEAETGTIKIEARPLPPSHIEIVFADDGKGMTEDIQRRAFDPFFTTRRGKGGAGLGLHIVYTLVTRQLGGEIDLSSEPGKGSTFRIKLPTVAPWAELEAAAQTGDAKD